MDEQGNSPTRPLSGSRSYLASSTAGVSSSRPFLNMLNPMGRKYQGYAQANQSVLEEDEEEERDDAALEAGRASHLPQSRTAAARPHGGRRVSWGAGGAPEASTLRPNIRQQDGARDAQDSSDDEVPQSFMIEAAAPRKSASSRARAKAKARDKDAAAPSPSARKPAAPLLPAAPDVATRVSIPPRPSELDMDDARDSAPQQAKQMRGLDSYERALWNWVNVYNLDAFLQEVYYYYEGKGIYCIALSRGLNLLSVTPVSFCTTWNQS